MSKSEKMNLMFKAVNPLRRKMILPRSLLKSKENMLRI
jgi:hypothetical protein